MSEIEASDGVKLYVEAHGEGTPILFSCAYSTTHENWRGQVEPLVAAGYRVLLWDYRGHGGSGVPENSAGFSMDQVVADLGCVLDWGAGGQPAVLAGLSFGGLASLHFAHHHPDRVRALVLSNTGPGFKKPVAAEQWRARSERTAEIIEERGLRAFVDGKAGVTCVGRNPELPAARAAGDAIAAQDPHGVAEFGRRVAGLAPSVIDELAEIQAPALVLVGEHDVAYVQAGEVMAAKLPNAQHQVLSGVAHIANIEDADSFNAVVVRFLDALD
jgi:pimeloyl-ACP methyl ester carboxylesterase